MIKCEICGRTINEIVDQDGSVTLQSDEPLVCDRCQQKEELKQQTEILRKAIECDKVKIQLRKQEEIRKKLEEAIQGLEEELDCKQSHISELEITYKQYKNATTKIIIQKLQQVLEECFNQKELVDFGHIACFMVDITDIIEIVNQHIKELEGGKNE